MPEPVTVEDIIATGWPAAESHDAAERPERARAILAIFEPLREENAELKTLLADSRSRSRALEYDRNLWKTTSDAHASVLEADLEPLRSLLGNVDLLAAFNSLRARVGELEELLERRLVENARLMRRCGDLGASADEAHRLRIDEGVALRAKLAEAEQEVKTLTNDVRKTIGERERAYADCASEHREVLTLREQLAFMTAPERQTAAQHTIKAMQGERDVLRAQLADAAVAEREESIARRDTLIRDLTTRLGEEEGKVVKRDVVIAAKDAALRKFVDEDGTSVDSTYKQALAALALTPDSLRERAGAERRVIEAAAAWAAEDAHGDGSQRSHEARQAATDDLFRAAHALVTQPAPPAQPHDHNGNCRWRRAIVHTPGEERDGG